MDRVAALGVRTTLLDEGLDELAQVVRRRGRGRPGRLVVADLKIARGLDYYTGTVYETQLAGHERSGSICSGGRYDSLASDGRTTYPGVGISIGVTRMLGLLLRRGMLDRVSRPMPTCVLVAVPDEDCGRARSRSPRALRARGIADRGGARPPTKYGKQIRYAERRRIPFVWFPSSGEGGPAEGGSGAGGEVKDIRTGEQLPADADRWTPPAADLRPVVAPAP